MENDRKIRMSRVVFGTIALLTILQVGLTGAVIFFVLSGFTLEGLSNVLALVNVGVILLVDAFIIYWLVQLFNRWEPDEG